MNLVISLFLDTRVDPSLVDNLGKLERQKIADHLNERLLSRPGPIELIQDRILPVESQIQNAIEQNVNFDNVSPLSRSSDSSVLSEIETGLNTLNCQSPSSPPPVQDPFSSVSLKNYINKSKNEQLRIQNTYQSTQAPSVPSQISISQKENEKLVRQVNKKQRQTKPKVKKLKFHNCQPPDAMFSNNAETNVDDRYKKLLEQQTLYLRLQVMQQNAMMNALQGNPENIEAVTEEIENVVQKEQIKSLEHSLLLEGKKIDDLRVVDLRAHLKQRGLVQSGPKAKLVERLIAYQEGRSVPSDFSGSQYSDVGKTAAIKSNSIGDPVDNSMMQVTTYAADNGQSYQVVQAVPQAEPYQVVQAIDQPQSYQVLSNTQVGLQNVVVATQSNIPLSPDSLPNLSPTDLSQISPNQLSPTFVIQQHPLQGISLVEELHNQSMVNQDHINQLSQSVPVSQMTTQLTHQSLTNIQTADLLRDRAATEPQRNTHKESKSLVSPPGQGTPSPNSFFINGQTTATGQFKIQNTAAVSPHGNSKTEIDLKTDTTVGYCNCYLTHFKSMFLFAPMTAGILSDFLLDILDNVFNPLTAE